jgi:WD40 repeat protein
VTALSVSANNLFLISGHAKGAITLWDLVNKAYVLTVYPESLRNIPISSICCSDGDNNIFIAGDCQVSANDLQTDTLIIRATCAIIQFVSLYSLTLLRLVG